MAYSSKAPGKQCLQNLLTNSQWMAMSGSTLENVGSQISISGIASGVCTTSNTQGLAVGKLFKFDSGTVTGTYEVTALTANVSFTINDTSRTEASAHTGYEVTPGYVAADTLAPDGWYKNGVTSHKVYRQHNDATFTKAGSFYALKVVVSTIETGTYWPLSATAALAEHYLRFAGRTVTFGAWVYATESSKARLAFYDGAYTYSSYHSGNSAWEWIEVTRSLATSITNFQVGLMTTNTTAYFSQPMLVYGDKIGAGNYQPIPNEVIHFATYVEILSNYSPPSGNTLLNIEAISSGKIGKGAKAITGYMIFRNTAAAKYCSLSTLGSGAGNIPMVQYTQVANQDIIGVVNGALDANGDINITVPDANCSGVFLRINAIQT